MTDFGVKALEAFQSNGSCFVCNFGLMLLIAAIKGIAFGGTMGAGDFVGKAISQFTGDLDGFWAGQKIAKKCSFLDPVINHPIAHAVTFLFGTDEEKTKGCVSSICATIMESYKDILDDAVEFLVGFISGELAALVCPACTLTTATCLQMSTSVGSFDGSYCPYGADVCGVAEDAKLIAKQTALKTARKNMMNPGNKHYQMVQEQMQIYERFDQGRDIDSSTCKNQYSGSAYCFNEKCFVDEHMALYKTCWYNKEPNPEASGVEMRFLHQVTNEDAGDSYTYTDNSGLSDTQWKEWFNECEELVALGKDNGGIDEYANRRECRLQYDKKFRETTYPVPDSMGTKESNKWDYWRYFKKGVDWEMLCHGSPYSYGTLDDISNFGKGLMQCAAEAPETSWLASRIRPCKPHSCQLDDECQGARVCSKAGTCGTRDMEGGWGIFSYDYTDGGLWSGCCIGTRLNSKVATPWGTSSAYPPAAYTGIEDYTVWKKKASSKECTCYSLKWNLNSDKKKTYRGCAYIEKYGDYACNKKKTNDDCVNSYGREVAGRSIMYCTPPGERNSRGEEVWEEAMNNDYLSTYDATKSKYDDDGIPHHKAPEANNPLMQAGDKSVPKKHWYDEDGKTCALVPYDVAELDCTVYAGSQQEQCEADQLDKRAQKKGAKSKKSGKKSFAGGGRK